eukprot:3932102-Prymnesium_polylepis.1
MRLFLAGVITLAPQASPGPILAASCGMMIGRPAVGSTATQTESEKREFRRSAYRNVCNVMCRSHAA